MTSQYPDFIHVNMRPDPYRNQKPLEDIFPRLRTNDRVPLSASQCLEWRLERGKKLLSKIPPKNRKYDPDYEPLQKDYRLWCQLITGDALAYHPDGRIKIVYDSEDLRNTHSPEDFILCKYHPEDSDQWKDKFLRLTEERYRQLDGQEFKRKELEKYLHQPLTTIGEILNPFLLMLVRGQKQLLREYARLSLAIPDFVSRYPKPRSRMQTIIGDPGEFVLSPWRIEGIANHESQVRADWGYGIHYSFGSCQSLLLGVPHGKK